MSNKNDKPTESDDKKPEEQSLADAPCSAYPEAKYVHCPDCDDLDRHFCTSMDGEWYCQKCRKSFPRVAFKNPEVSDKWIVSSGCSEISIVQMKDLHGRISGGWFSDSKILIAEAQAPHESSEMSPVYDELVKLAEREAEKRNSQQNAQSLPPADTTEKR